MYDIPVVSLTSDGAKPNRRFYSMCQQQQQKGKSKDVPYKTFNPFREGKDLFFFCDAPHLLKTARNCFSNSFAHSNSRKMQVIPPPHFMSLSVALHTHSHTHARTHAHTHARAHTHTHTYTHTPSI